MNNILDAQFNETSEELCLELLRIEVNELNNVSKTLENSSEIPGIENKTNEEKLELIHGIESKFTESVLKINSLIEQISKHVNTKIVKETEKII